MAFMAWPDIEGFHNIRKFVRIDPGEWWSARERLKGTSTVLYQAKVKLHGTNAAVQVHTDGTVVCQSRSNIITPESDNAGFARWVLANKEAWQRIPGFIIYGEWCGSGIQKGVAISNIGKRVFAVFAARPLDGSDTLIIEPATLQAAVGGIPDVYILPWYTRPVEHGSDTKAYAQLPVDWKSSDSELTELIAPVNQWVKDVETNDPWVKEIFNVDGTGEGLVFYPISEAHLGFESFSYLCFKAKGEKHKNIKTSAPVQVNPETAASISAFVDLVLTPARLEQGANAVGGFDMKLTGKFVGWCLSDLQKETQDELEASGLDWKQVQKPLNDRARTWYIEQVRLQ